MNQFEVLYQYLHDKKDLEIKLQKFTVSYAGHEITATYHHPNIHFEAESGTPNDTFAIEQPLNESATFSSVTTKKSFPKC